MPSIAQFIVSLQNDDGTSKDTAAMASHIAELNDGQLKLFVEVSVMRLVPARRLPTSVVCTSRAGEGRATKHV
jgi:hypothetical protein